MVWVPVDDYLILSAGTEDHGAVTRSARKAAPIAGVPLAHAVRKDGVGKEPILAFLWLVRIPGRTVLIVHLDSDNLIRMALNALAHAVGERGNVP